MTRSQAVRAMMTSLVSKGVGYLRSGPFTMGGMSWMSAFPNIRGEACLRQLRQLDAVRADILYPLQKMMGTAFYFGRPASYCGFLKRIARPGIGEGLRLQAVRIGYSEL